MRTLSITAFILSIVLFSCQQGEVDQTAIEDWRDVLKNCEVRIPLNGLQESRESIDRIVEEHTGEEIIAVHIDAETSEGVYTRNTLKTLKVKDGFVLGFLDIEDNERYEKEIYRTNPSGPVIYYSSFCFFEMLKENPVLNKVLYKQEYIEMPAGWMEEWDSDSSGE